MKLLVDNQFDGEIVVRMEMGVQTFTRQSILQASMAKLIIGLVGRDTPGHRVFQMRILRTAGSFFNCDGIRSASGI
jgi:hypothetical protein